MDSVCNDCHDLIMSSVKTNNIAIITIENVDYCCKSEAIRKNSVLENRAYI